MEKYRSLNTGYLTVMEKNPPNVALPPPGEPNEPKQKAIRLNMPSPIQIHDANSRMRDLIVQAHQSLKPEPFDFAVTGKLAVLTDAFFNEDPPLTGDPDKEKMCFKTTITDCTGTLDVKLWDRAGMQLFGMTASKLRAVWESGVEVAEKREDILTQLNIALKVEYTFACTGKVWSFGKSGSEKHSPDVNVDDIERKPGAEI